MKRMRMLQAATLAALALAGPATAEVIDKTGVFNGVKVQYRVITPPGYSPARTYPVILVFTGGSQEWAGVQRTLDEDWKAEAAKRGYILVSPAAADGHLYFDTGDRIFPAFLETIRKDYRATGKMHIAGHSNGGLSAYHIAVKNPAWFSTVTGYPGLLDPEQMKEAPALKPMCLFMHAGDLDVGWPEAMGGESDALKKMGYKITFVLEKGQGHRLKAAELDLPRRLFDEIESCK